MGYATYVFMGVVWLVRFGTDFTTELSGMHRYI
jgi:hypothetical protein